MQQGNSIASHDGATAAISNVAQVMRALDRAITAPNHLPKIVVHNGPSGYGKSFGATRAANHYRAYYVEVKSTWTSKALLIAILKEMQIKPAKTIYEMGDQAAEQLALSGRPLIVDEFDFLVDRSAVEVIRDLHEAAGGVPILLVGEEHLEKKLRQWERFHNRVLEWFPALPATADDTRKLADLYCRRVEVAEDLLAAIHQVGRGIVRRIVVNLERVQEFGVTHGFERVTLKDYGNDGFYTGEAPRRLAA